MRDHAAEQEPPWSYLGCGISQSSESELPDNPGKAWEDETQSSMACAVGGMLTSAGRCSECGETGSCGSQLSRWLHISSWGGASGCRRKTPGDPAHQAE